MVGLGQFRSASPEEFSLGCTKPPVDCWPSLGSCNPARCGAARNSPLGCRSAVGHFATTSNVYGNWGSSYVQRGDDWARTGHVTNRRTGTTTSGIRTDEGGAVRRSGPGGSGFVAGNGDNVYAGHDGSVYKRGDDGTWQKRENGGWNNTNRPDPSTSGQLASTSRKSE